MPTGRRRDLAASDARSPAEPLVGEAGAIRLRRACGASGAVSRSAISVGIALPTMPARDSMRAMLPRGDRCSARRERRERARELGDRVTNRAGELLARARDATACARPFGSVAASSSSWSTCARREQPNHHAEPGDVARDVFAARRAPPLRRSSTRPSPSAPAWRARGACSRAADRRDAELRGHPGIRFFESDFEVVTQVSAALRR